MQTIQQNYHQADADNASKVSRWQRFIQWADEQEKNHWGWAAGILVGHGCIATIFTMIAIIFTGNNFIFWPFAIVAMAACLITNLAAMPTRITIPVFFISLLVDVAIILICIVNGLTA